MDGAVPASFVDSDYDMERFITMIPNWKEEFQTADTQTKKMLLSSLIGKIEVKDGEISIKFKIRLEDFINKTACEAGWRLILPETIGSGVA